MRTILRLAMVLLLVLACRTAHAQPSLPLQVDLDQATFAYSQDQSLLEIYLAFGAQSFRFERDSLGFLATLPVDVGVVRSTEAILPGTPSDPVWQDSLLLKFIVADTSQLAPGQHFVHQVRALVPPGEYEMRIAVPGDASVGRQQLEMRREVVVPDYANSTLVGLSDLTLATTVQPTDSRQDPFYKNGLSVQPNANQLYGKGLEELYYYAEAYHTEQIAADDSSYTVFAYIAEANRPQPLPEMQRRSMREARSPDVLVGKFDVSTLPSGSYFLRIALLNEDNESMAEQARKFFVYNPDVQVEQPIAGEASFEMSPYASMPEEEVAQALKHIEPIATEQERRHARDIRDLDEQRRFLMEFWQRRDPDPATPLNEFKEEFYRRFQYANERYSGSRAEGWTTDRGRVMIKYGTPASVEPHLYDRETVPHEIWQYNNIPGEGQALFIFADRNGFGEFELIHSTVAGERKVPDWESELRR